jgi:hypothetical protein
VLVVCFNVILLNVEVSVVIGVVFYTTFGCWHLALEL